MKLICITGPTATGKTHLGVDLSLELDGEVKANIPLVGKKVEAQVEPFITDAFDGLERRAADWLSRGN